MLSVSCNLYPAMSGSSPWKNCSGSVRLEGTATALTLPFCFYIILMLNWPFETSCVWRASPYHGTVTLHEVPATNSVLCQKHLAENYFYICSVSNKPSGNFFLSNQIPAEILFQTWFNKTFINFFCTIKTNMF